MSNWAEKVKQRGYSQLVYTVLDVIEPIAPLIAQGLWVAQPLAGLWGGTTTLQQLAETLEDPDGIAQLRHYLADDNQE